MFVIEVDTHDKLVLFVNYNEDVITITLPSYGIGDVIDWFGLIRKKNNLM